MLLTIFPIFNEFCRVGLAGVIALLSQNLLIYLFICLVVVFLSALHTAAIFVNYEAVYCYTADLLFCGLEKRRFRYLLSVVSHI